MRLIVLGPPNSGKSTFLASLKAELEALGLQVTLVELDAASPTAELIAQEASPEEFARREKQDWTIDLAIQTAAKFKTAQGQVILGDAPGKIDEMTRILVQPAAAAIILIREDLLSNLTEWEDLAAQSRLRVIAIATTALEGDSDIDPETDPLLGRIVGLVRRRVSGNAAIQAIAMRVLELRQEAQERGAEA